MYFMILVFYYNRNDYMINDQVFFVKISNTYKLHTNQKNHYKSIPEDSIHQSKNNWFEIRELLWRGSLDFIRIVFYESKDLSFDSSENDNLWLKIIRKLKKWRSLKLAGSNSEWIHSCNRIIRSWWNPKNVRIYCTWSRETIKKRFSLSTWR